MKIIAYLAYVPNHAIFLKITYKQSITIKAYFAYIPNHAIFVKFLISNQ